jgi:Mlc titration factor MtfA (ptsG expression regulator)
MVLKWWRKRRRKQMRSRSFPEAWHQFLDRNVRSYDLLSPTEQGKLRGDLQILVAEKNWEGCGGLQMTEEIQVTIGAQACLLILGLREQYFDRVRSVLVYPDSYVAPDRTITKGGVVLEGKSAREGEAWYRGPVVLAWAEALAGGRGQTHGDNLVLHEFAHQLDMQNGGEIDGTPRLETVDQVRRWREVMSREYERLVSDCQRGTPTLLDCYGTTDVAEFFAVATECFFERSRAMQHRHPQLFGLLRDFYRQDPAARL